MNDVFEEELRFCETLKMVLGRTVEDEEATETNDVLFALYCPAAPFHPTAAPVPPCRARPDDKLS